MAAARSHPSRLAKWLAPQDDARYWSAAPRHPPTIFSLFIRGLIGVVWTGQVAVSLAFTAPAGALVIIPTEPIGSIPRPLRLIEAIASGGDTQIQRWSRFTRTAIRDTIERFEATGSPVITDGEQRKYHNFWTYSVHGCRTPRRTDSRFRSRPAIPAGCRG